MQADLREIDIEKFIDQVEGGRGVKVEYWFQVYTRSDNVHWRGNTEHAGLKSRTRNPFVHLLPGIQEELPNQHLGVWF
jgi:hypothetical protein